MNYILLLIYIIVVYLNIRYYSLGKTNNALALFSSIIATLFLCGSNIAYSDSYVGELDISSYRNEYEQLNFLENIDFPLYYLFFYANYLGQQLGLTFSQWWLLMSASSILLIYLACKTHNFNYNLVIGCFMAYYEIVFYSGLKAYYAFCFLFLAYGYLLKGDIKSKLLYILFVCIAGGFHVMYYIFLVLLFRPKNASKKFMKAFVVGIIVFTIVMRLGGSVISFMKPFFDYVGNDHINTYMDDKAVGNGFYIAIILEIVMVSIPYYIRKTKLRNGSCTQITDNYYYSVLLTYVFCPFYALSLIFVRIITAFSLVVIGASSAEVGGSLLVRRQSLRLSLLMVGSYVFKQVFLDFPANVNFRITA